MKYKLLKYLEKKYIQFDYNYGYGYEIKDFHYNKFLDFMKSYPLSYNIDDEIKENKIDNILLYKPSNNKYYNSRIKIITTKKDNLSKTFYYDLEPIIKLSENKEL